MASFKQVVNKLKPYLAMVFLQFGYAGMNVIAVASLKQGMSHYVLVVYRNAAAAVVIAPFALWIERLISLLSVSPPSFSPLIHGPGRVVCYYFHNIYTVDALIYIWCQCLILRLKLIGKLE